MTCSIADFTGQPHPPISFGDLIDHGCLRASAVLLACPVSGLVVMNEWLVTTQRIKTSLKESCPSRLVACSTILR